MTTSYQSSGTVNLTIPDGNNSGVTSTINVSGSNTIEALQIKLNVTHAYSGDLAVELTSPAGTTSVLLTPFNSFLSGDNYTNLVLASNAFYGESTAGNWTVRLIDGSTPDQGGLVNWSIRFFGH